MSDGFHFMTYEIHFMPEPAAALIDLTNPSKRLLNEYSFSII
jgi:hypothetical protein